MAVGVISLLGLCCAAIVGSAASGSLTASQVHHWLSCSALVHVGRSASAGKASVTAPVRTCSASDQPQADINLQSGCNGGSAFTCSNQQPIIVNDTLAYGFAAAKLSGQGEGDWCCGCYMLKFTSGAVAGKVMVVQV
jgi:hypothetical protein